MARSKASVFLVRASAVGTALAHVEHAARGCGVARTQALGRGFNRQRWAGGALNSAKASPSGWRAQRVFGAGPVGGARVGAQLPRSRAEKQRCPDEESFA